MWRGVRLYGLVILILGLSHSLLAVGKGGLPNRRSPLNHRIGKCETYVAALAHPDEVDRIRGWKYLISENPDQALKAIDVGALDATVLDQTNVSTFMTAVIHRQHRIVDRYLSAAYLYALSKRDAHWLGKNADHRKLRAEIINAQDLEGNSSLHYAVLSEDAAMVEKLLANGGDKNRRNRLGQTPQDLARGKSFERLMTSEALDQSH